ncbi:hypothetical protein A2V56_03245 [Candidatus Woesebacteria bacterium RBG_19FT_COMBO_42_9]|uniref:DUF2207 domain-containing protein n=1 Tax=Candidatus Woesebacteria bacterium RBG_16_42_24 TaxID=1802485 RepID=A0A1F7XJY3_9BACT|nr:MAG: hypothetical protein A2V97_01860 [Candidatus Woesebacteria bacterium RBG_16_42_24]OGM16393.1 MAG: hypothetical protein A2V56_03245 [Candidatus Woesebacteria bacterium RBG_19FT_COMBO_42_9]OGM66405.1 MAG: hypothetical protein A2985_03700 [Candidatus Woesebacteria bacterium RIFCSPLOWO2_01_FULL_43_11]
MLLLRKIFSVFSVFLLFFLATQGKVYAQDDTGWIIESFKADIRVNQDTTVGVTETIIVDFAGLQKHGIYRTIPVKYQTQYGNNLNIRLNLLSVTDSGGKKLETKITKEGNNTKIRIGDPDLTITGRNTYVITYKVSQVITTPGESAELYWNVTGNDWPVSILSATANVYTPDGSLINTACFTGYFGSQEENCTKTSERDTATFTTKNVDPQQGLTVAVALDKSALTFPTSAQKLLIFLLDNWLYLVPIAVLIIMFRLYMLKGRDKKFIDIFNEQLGEEPVPLLENLNAISTSVSPPRNLSPGEVGTLVDEKAHLRDITATVIDLARRGFIKIEEESKKGLFGKTKFTLHYTKKDEGVLKPYELSVLDMLFSEKRDIPAVLTKLHPKAYQSLKEAEKNLYEDLTMNGYFEGRPDEVRNKYLAVGIITIFAGFFLGGGIAPFIVSPASFFIAFIGSGLIIIAFSFFMPARTGKGRKALAEIVGFKEVLNLGSWRTKIYEKHNFFEEVLPYAIAFGITEKFIQAFKDADIKNLNWYHGTNLNIVHFNASLGYINTGLGSGISASRPKGAASGGSGFGGGGGSGGGFGGGGGGSW